MHATTPATVVFDLGGVLIDWDPRYLYRKVFADDPARMERFLAEVCTSAWNLQMDAGKPFSDGIAELATVHPAEAPRIALFFDRWIEMVRGAFPGTVAILERLDRAGVHLVALTNWSRETFPLVRQDPAYAFLDRFATILVSGEEGVAKPDPLIFERLLERIERPAGACFFIDDNIANIQAARALGFDVHHHTTSSALRAALSDRGLPA